MKKSILLILIISLLTALLAGCGGDKPPEGPTTQTAAPADPWDAAATPEDAFEFTGGVITKYIGDFEVVRVPREIGGMDVVAIGEGAFEKNTTVTEVYLPPNVKRIENKAFEWAEKLRIVDLGEVETVGDNAFLMTKLTSLTMSPAVTTIGNRAFNLFAPDAGEAVAIEIVIPASAISLGDDAFSSPRFTKITFEGEILPEFGDSCFSPLGANAVIVVADSFGEDVAAEVYGKFAAAGLFSGNDIIHMDGSPLFLDYSADFDINYDLGYIVAYWGDNTDVIIPPVIEGVPVVQISNGAFTGNENIRSVVIPDGVEIIESLAFSGCTSLESVVIPDSVTLVEYQAFEDTTSLKSVVWSANADVPKLAFSESGIESIVIPDGVKSIGEAAFRNCVNLKDVSIGNTVTEMGESVFENCIGLEVIDFLPESLEVIPALTFLNCESVSEIHIPEGVKRIEFAAFQGCGSMARYKDEWSPGVHGVAAKDPKAELGDKWVNDDRLPKYIEVHLPSTIEVLGSAVFSGVRIDGLYMPDGLHEVSQLPEFTNTFGGMQYILFIYFDDETTEEQLAAMDQFFMGFENVGDRCWWYEGWHIYYTTA